VLPIKHQLRGGEGAKYVWVTSKLKKRIFEIPAKKRKERIAIPDVQQCGVQNSSVSNSPRMEAYEDGSEAFSACTVGQDELTVDSNKRIKLFGGRGANPSEHSMN